MGILTNALSISIGGALGERLKKYSTENFLKVCGFCLIIISVVGFFQNVYVVDGKNFNSDGLILIVLSLIIGYLIGAWLKLGNKLSKTTTTLTDSKTAFIDSTMFFSIGGLQISGAILLASTGSSSILYIKTLTDLPFAIILGSTLGKTVSLSSIPVAIIQVAIFFIAKLLGDFISSECLRAVCAVSYVILFFSGYNLLVEEKNKFNNVNLIPAIFLILIYQILARLIGG